MKRVLAACVLALASCVVASDSWSLRDGVPNAVHFAHANRVGNQYIFCMSDRGQSPWRAMCTALEKMTGCRAMLQNFVVPEGLWFTQYCNVRGQAVFGERVCSGYLALLDFSASAASADAQAQAVLLENLVRAIYTYRLTHSIVIVHTVASPWIAQAEKVADHYGIPTLDLTSETTTAARDAAATRFMDALFTPPAPPKAVARKLPTELFPASDGRARIVAYENRLVKRTGAWKPGQRSPIRPYRHLLVSETPGDTFTLTSPSCSEFGLLDVVGSDTAPLEYAIDGGAWQTLPPPAGQTAFATRVRPLASGLDRARPHTLSLRTAGKGVLRLGGILLNGDMPNEYAGLADLARIDAIYADMKPVTVEIDPNRFAHIPQAMKKFREGGTLRMLLLGDSIIGCTASSRFPLLLNRAFPKCRLETTVSIRSSTGCNWYCQENRVDEWVVRHRPELLVIGGISNGNDAEVVRSVVRQARAKLPELEVLLLTPVFGPLVDAERNPPEWGPTIDFTKPNFRAGMKRVADEEKCAFFDMRGPWWSYVRDSGMTPGWFWSDGVHGNARGCQIIGRLLEKWFTDGLHLTTSPM